MHRHAVNQAFLDVFENPSYLEIGVDQGVTFHKVQAARKVAVDPRFGFDWQGASADPANSHCSYHQMTSDEYFARFRDRETFDYIFIDGLHTFEQTLRDLMNAIVCLRPDGIIVVDDVLPSTYAASLSSRSLSQKFWAASNNPDKSWMGDVFRLVFFVETFLPAFQYATVAENHGQLVMWRQARYPVQERTVLETSNMEFVDTVMRRDSFAIAPLEQIKQAFAAGRPWE